MDQLSNLNWSDLRILLTTRDHGGASHAARAIGRSHHTVSRRLTVLESALGLRLVNREHPPWILMVKGTAVCDHAAQMGTITRGIARYALRTQPHMVERVSIASNV